MLKLAEGLKLPVHLVTESVGILAKRRAGKSTTARRLTEQLNKAKQQVVVADPKGDWWGLLFGVDGKSPGLPFVVLGGEHGHIKLEVGAGELVARMVVTERVSLVLDLSEFRKHEVATFMTAFMETLYRLKAQEQYRTPMMLILDEADAIAPQKPQKGEERMLGAAEDLVRRGGQRGIGVTLITQRSAVLNKNVLTQINILLILRTIAPQDLDAVHEWVKVHGTKEQGAALMASLPSLQQGTGWVWAPGWPDVTGIFKRCDFILPETFDSSATPGQQKRVEPKNAADVDLDAFKREMAATIEKAKADDPRELRKQIAELRKQRALKSSAIPEKVSAPVREKVVEKPVLTDADRALLAKVGRTLESMAAELGGRSGAFLAGLEQRLEQVVEGVMVKCRQDGERVHDAGRKQFSELLEAKGFQRILEKLAAVPKPDIIVTTKPQRSGIRPDARIGRSDPLVAPTGAPLKTMHRAMLTVLAQAGKSLSKKQIRVRTGYRDSGPVSKAFAELLREGWAVMNGTGLYLTDGGRSALGDYEVRPTGIALRTALVNGSVGKLNGMERKFMDVLVRAYPAEIPKADLRERCGYADSGPVSKAFAHLVALDYALAVGKGALKVSDELFEED